FLCSEKGLGKSLQKIGRHERVFAYTLAHHIAGKSMQAYSRKRGQKRARWMLRHHSRDHARENVSRAPGGHARIARHIDPHLAVGMHYQGAMTFKHDDEF